MTLVKMDTRTRWMELLVQGAILFVLVAQVGTIRSTVFSGDISRRSGDGSKPVYLFLKLWRPPLLHYHDDLSRQSAKSPTKPSPYAFYHTYGKRSDTYEQSRETDEIFREFTRPIRRPHETRSMDYSQEADSEW